MKWLWLIPFAVWALWLWRSAGYREVEQAVDPASGVVPFADARIGDESYAYVDEDGLTDHYCVFSVDDWFDERDGEIRLRRQRWKLLEDEPLILPDPYQPDPDDGEPDLGIVFLAADDLNAEALTAAHLAVEDVLIEFRDARISIMGPANGFVVREYDGTESSVMRLGTRAGLAIGIAAYLRAAALHACDLPDCPAITYRCAESRTP